MVLKTSLHPPHLIDSRGFLPPSVFIPFCAYHINMNLLERKNENLSFNTCSQFNPTLLEGQLCYSLNLRSIETEKAKVVKGSGLTIILDQGILSNTNKPNKEEEDKENTERSLDLRAKTVEDNSARIYLSTLSSFTDHRAGSYALTALKKITGTGNFLKQPNEVKKCITGTYEECQARKYIENVQKQCGCVPWVLTSALTTKV